MYRASTDNKFILVVLDEVINYLVTIPLYRRTLYKVREQFIKHIFCKHGPTFNLTFVEDHVFLSSVMHYTYKKLCIKI